MNLDKFTKILIVRLSSLGDILLTTPMYRTVKKMYPDILIDALVLKQYKDVLQHNPFINNIFFYEKENAAREVLTEQLNLAQYDAVIDLQNNYRSKSLIKKLNVKTYSFSKHHIKKFLLVKFKINLLKTLPPVAERYAQSLPSFLLDGDGLDIFIPESVTPSISKNGKYIGFCPGSRHYTKMWLLEYYVELGKKLYENGFTVVLLGGKSDIEICRLLKNEIPNSINLSTEDNILQMAADMKQCAVVVCNDSGLMHTACAVRVPVLAIYGSTVKEFGFTPYKNHNLILENISLSCRPCSHIGGDVCPKKHFKCMKALTPLTAYNYLQQLLKL